MTDKTNGFVTPTITSEELFDLIAKDIKANPDCYKEAGKWLDNHFGENARQIMQQKGQQYELVHCFNCAIENTIGKNTLAKPAALPLRLTPKKAYRLLLLIWLLTDTDDLSKMPMLTEFQLLPYEHDDCDVIIRDDEDYDEANKQRTYAMMFGYIESRKFLFNEIFGKESEYGMLLSATHRAWKKISANRPGHVSESRQVVEHPVEGKPKKRGRKGFTDEKRQQYYSLCEEWERAHSTGVSKKDFVTENKISRKRLENALSYRRKKNER